MSNLAIIFLRLVPPNPEPRFATRVIRVLTTPPLASRRAGQHPPLVLPSPMIGPSAIENPNATAAKTTTPNKKIPTSAVKTSKTTNIPVKEI